MGILHLIAQTSATPNGWSWHDTATTIISSAAFLVSAIALWLNRSDKHRDLHLEHLLRVMQELENRCAAYAVEVEENLLYRCHQAGGDHGDCHRKATLMYRDAAAQLELLEKLLPIAAKRLFTAFKEWHSALTDNHYPVERAEDALRPGDSRINDIRNAQKDWNTALCDLRVACLSRRLKFWKGLGQID
jgi:hypothetical protein